MSRQRRRPKAEINVVPFIDVMLVLLVIFMITAPLINQGVEIELPRASADALPASEQRPLILTVDDLGNYYLSTAAEPDRPQSSEEILAAARATLQRNPQVTVLVRADQGVAYGAVVAGMALLQRAGAEKVGLSTEPPRQ